MQKPRIDPTLTVFNHSAERNIGVVGSPNCIKVSSHTCICGRHDQHRRLLLWAHITSIYSDRKMAWWSFSLLIWCVVPLLSGDSRDFNNVKQKCFRHVNNHCVLQTVEDCELIRRTLFHHVGNFLRRVRLMNLFPLRLAPTVTQIKIWSPGESRFVMDGSLQWKWWIISRILDEFISDNFDKWLNWFRHSSTHYYWTSSKGTTNGHFLALGT